MAYTRRGGIEVSSLEALRLIVLEVCVRLKWGKYLIIKTLSEIEQER